MDDHDRPVGAGPGSDLGSPDGRLTTGRTGRYVLPSAETLHQENKALKIRIRELENALKEASHQNSHPLLEPGQLAIANSERDHPQPVNEDPLLNKFGTIQSNRGGDRWLGVSADFRRLRLSFDKSLGHCALRGSSKCWSPAIRWI